GTDTLTVSPTSTTTYRVIALSDSNGCAAQPADLTSSVVVTVNADSLPTANVSGSAAICINSSNTVTATLTGNEPWTVTWTDGTIHPNVYGAWQTYQVGGPDPVRNDFAGRFGATVSAGSTNIVYDNTATPVTNSVGQQLFYPS